MADELIINITGIEARIALIEDGVLVEFYREHDKERGIVGNIYKGRVLKILPGIQAAFVEIGEERSGFLYVADAYQDNFDDPETLIENGWPQRSNRPPIESLLVQGQEILVQVAKEPIGSKGARLSTHLSIPGRYLVLMPNVDHIGISRRIEHEAERERLKSIVSSIKPSGFGFIIRTVAEGCSEENLRNDMNFLIRMWQDIHKRIPSAQTPSILHTDLPLSLRAIRDLFTPNIRRIVVDSPAEHQRIVDFFHAFLPEVSYHIELYDQDEPIFDRLGIEESLNRALSRKIWLKSGGYLVIDQTEALTTIDVNTGRFVGKQNFEETILKTNLEAVTEIVYQLRLRNIGGIIIVDFIDMEKEANRHCVYQALNEALKSDRMKTNILKISDLGLIEMTRKRTRDSLIHMLCDPCPYCRGSGHIKSRITLIHDIFRAVQRAIPTIPEEEILIQVHPEIAQRLWNEEKDGIVALEQRYKRKVTVKAAVFYHREQYDICGISEAME